MAQESGFGSLRKLLEEGFVACAIVSGQIVSIAHTYARTTHYADIGVHTLERWRRGGLASAAASIVARCIQEAGQTPVWSTGEDNWASLRVAQKLGFVESSRRTYVIPTADNQER
jgi:predicted GNAT family acetyltransferase